MVTDMRGALFILYVADQSRSSRFYETVLGRAPRLEVPGMTEFELGGSEGEGDCALGLMPVNGIRRLLGERLPDPGRGDGIPRAELYLRVDEPARFHARAIGAGAVELSALEDRDWGDRAAYSLDPDGHVIAFAAPIQGAG